MHDDCSRRGSRRSRSFLLTASFLLAIATPSLSQAGVFWTVTAETLHGEPLDALNTTSQILIDVTGRTDDQVVDLLSASIGGYDPNLLSFNRAIVSESIFVGLAVSAGEGFGGVDNAISTPVEEIVGGVGRVRFLDGLAAQSPTLGDGSADLSPVDFTVGGPQFRLVFDWVGGVGGADLQIGTFAAFGDAFVGAPGEGVANAVVSVSVIPEPSTALLLALGLAHLATRREAL